MTATMPAWFGELQARKVVQTAQPTRHGVRLIDAIRARHGTYVAVDDRRLVDVPDLLDLLAKVETGRLVLSEREQR